MKNVLPSIRTVVLCAAVGMALSLSPHNARGESVTAFARAEAIKWQGQAINVAPLMDYYKRRFFKGVWTGNQGLTKDGIELVKVLQASGQDGLEPADYLSALPANLDQLTGENLAAAELYLSQSAANYARDLYGGRTTPAVSEPDIVIARKRLDLVALLGSMDKNGAGKVADRLRPQHRQYAALREMLAGAEDGAERAKIIVNMERWRWLPRDLGDSHVLVNAAAFKLYVRSGNKTVATKRVIVGQPYHKTPMFSHNVEYAELNPTWTITPNIAGNEILPHLRKDPGYLERKGYILYTSWEADAPAMNAHQIDWSAVSQHDFPYRIVQPAGPDNVLGQIKFLFPNKFNVYLHDTSSRQLFDQSERALSHGCIRVEKPLELAQLLYQMDRNPAAGKIPAILQTGKTTRVNFRRPIPIHLTYFTLWVEDDGKVSRYPDIYGRDKSVANLLFGRV